MLIQIKYRRHYNPEVFGFNSFDEMPPMPEAQTIKTLSLVGKVPYSSAWAGAGGAEWHRGEFDVFADEHGNLFTVEEQRAETPSEAWLAGWPAYFCYNMVATHFVNKEVGEWRSCKNPRYWHGTMKSV